MTQKRKAASAAVLLLGFLIMVGCGDTYRPIAYPITKPGGDPQTFDYVAIINTNGTNNGSVMQINVGGDSASAVAPVGQEPATAGFNYSQTALLVPNNADDTLSEITSGSTTATTLTLETGSKPTFVGAVSSGLFTLNSGANTICPSSPSLGVIDGSSFTLRTDVCVGTNPVFGVAVDADRVFVVDKGANKVYVVNVTTDVVTNSISVGTAPVYAALSPDGTYAYVLNQGSDDISVIDTTAETVVATIPAGGSAPSMAVFDSTLTRLYVVNTGSDSVSVFDASTYSSPKVLHTPVTLSGTPNSFAVLPDGSRAYAGLAGTNQIAEINTGSYSVKTLTVGTTASSTVTSVGRSNDGTKVYATTVEPNDLQNGTTIIRTTDDVTVGNIPAPLQDPSCSGTSCKLQRPYAVISR